MTRAVVCADLGSTWTKAAAVDLDTGDLLGVAAHPTTLGTDVLDGVDQVRVALATQLPYASFQEVLACSSAGGGLRLAVVGYERAVTAEAGYRVGLSAGARVVHVAAGKLDVAAVSALVASEPDVVLLAGGTDGGDSDVLRHNGDRLSRSRLRCPFVVAGNAEVRDEVVMSFMTRGKQVVPTANVLPRIGVLDAEPARAAIREVFIKHVIGGKDLTRRGGQLSAMVKAATPDAVLAGVEVLADGARGAAGVGDVLVVDVGGATTDVYSVVTPDPEEAALRREVVEAAWRGRTVEGDLGVRWSATGVLEAALVEQLVTEEEAAALRPGAERRVADPAYVASGDDLGADVALASLAATIACRRHARPQVVTTGDGAQVRRGGRDLREVGLVVGSGGVLRHAPPDVARRVLEAVVGDLAGGWKLPEHPRLVVDTSYVLAPAGLLALTGRPELAIKLLMSQLG